MQEKINSILRFDPDGECLLVAVDFIFYFFRKKYLDEHRLICIKNMINLIEFLKKEKFQFIISSPFLSILSPIYWYIKFKYGNVSRTDFIKKKITLTRFIILIQDTPKKIYGIKNENWSHFIVYFNNYNEYGIYDPLKFILEKENKINSRNEEIANNGFLKILIWEQ